MTHIYHFILNHRIGGPHIYVDTLRKALGEKFNSYIVTTGKGAMTDIGLVRLRHIWTPLYSVELICNVILIIALVYSGKIKRKKTIFHIHGGATVAPIFAARFFKIPIVWTIHETVSNYQSLVKLGLKAVSSYPHKLVVVATACCNSYSGFKNAILIPGAVNDAFWNARNVNEILANNSWVNGDGLINLESLRILTIANLTPIKGIDILLSSLDKLDGPWEINIVGMTFLTHESYSRKLHQYADEIMANNPNKKISFVGWKNSEAVRELLAGCDIFVLPSRSEACPLALLEAMAMSCYCVAANVGDVKIIMNSYKNSNMFELENSVELLTHLEKYQKSNHRFSLKLKSDEHNMFSEKYTLRAFSSSYESVYSSLIRASV